MQLDDARVLVTGGAGFVGSHVSRRLLERGARVHAVDSLVNGRRSLMPAGARLHEVDVRDADALGEAVRRVDPELVVHLAARHYVPYCNEHPEEAFDVNVMGTRHLLAAARTLADLERVVYTSSAAVYPPRDEPHGESDPPGPTDVYGRTKLVGEDLLELFVADTGVPATTVRLFNAYGTDDTNPHLIPAILEQIEDGTREIELGNLTPARDFVHVDDVADAILELSTESRDGYRAYNVGSGQAWSVRGVVEQVGAALGEEIVVEQASDRVRESDRPYLCADITRIERETDWAPETEFVDGLRALLAAEGITT